MVAHPMNITALLASLTVLRQEHLAEQDEKKKRQAERKFQRKMAELIATGIQFHYDSQTDSYQPGLLGRSGPYQPGLHH